MPAAIVGQRRRPRAHGNVDVGWLEQLEPRRQDADDRVGLTIELQGATQHVSVGTEAPDPQVVTQDRDSCGARLVIGCPEHTPQR